MIPSLLYVILPCFVVLLSVSSLLHGRDKQFVVLSGIAILVFRSELILFYGPCLLYGLLQGSVRLRPALWLTAFLTAVSSVGKSRYNKHCFSRLYLSYLSSDRYSALLRIDDNNTNSNSGTNNY